MTARGDFGPAVALEVIRVKSDGVVKGEQSIPTEVPFTIRVGDLEIVTMQCTPSHLTELSYGFLHSSGFIASAADVRACVIDTTRWVAEVAMDEAPDADIIAKRIYTAGCGRGVMYGSLSEAAARLPLMTEFSVARSQVVAAAQWLQHASSLYQTTGGIHTAALSMEGAIPGQAIDDIGRHNAVDKVIGAGLLAGTDFTHTMLLASGRISSEILHKARRCGIPMIVARGTPTHQTVLRARDMGVSVVGRARGTSFMIFSHEERIRLED